MKLPRPSGVVREIPLFAVGGVTATALNYVAALAAQDSASLSSLPAGVVGYAAAVGVSGFGNSLLDVPPSGDAWTAVRPVRAPFFR